MIEPDYGGYQWCAAIARSGKPCKQKGWVPDIDTDYFCQHHRPKD